MPERVGEQNFSKASVEVGKELEKLQAALGPQTLTQVLGTPAAERALETARANNDSQTIHSLTRYVELSRLPLSDAQHGLMAGARLQLEQGNNSGFQEGVAAVSALNSQVVQSITADWSVEQQMKFAQHWVNQVDFDYYSRLSYDGQLRTANQVLSSFNTQEGLAMSQSTMNEMSAAMATTIAGEMRGADLETMQRVWAATNMEELRAAATYLSLSESNSFSSFVDGGPALDVATAQSVGNAMNALDQMQLSEQEEELRDAIKKKMEDEDWEKEFKDEESDDKFRTGIVKNTDDALGEGSYEDPAQRVILEEVAKTLSSTKPVTEEAWAELFSKYPEVKMAFLEHVAEVLGVLEE